jgi:hypothetical protein
MIGIIRWLADGNIDAALHFLVPINQRAAVPAAAVIDCCISLLLRCEKMRRIARGKKKLVKAPELGL